MSDQGKDYAAAAAWAEHEMVLPVDSTTALRGEAAAAFGRGMVARAVGRPALDPAAAAGEHSPRRQVRLPRALSDDVDQLAATQGRTAAEVMREAITDYLTRNQAG